MTTLAEVAIAKGHSVASISIFVYSGDCVPSLSEVNDNYEF